MNQKGKSEGKFTFTSAGIGQHEICFQTNAGGGWFTNTHVKFHLDVAVGATHAIESRGNEKVTEMAKKVQDLNNRLQDIRREQIFQRVHSILISNNSDDVGT